MLNRLRLFKLKFRGISLECRAICIVHLSDEHIFLIFAVFRCTRNVGFALLNIYRFRTVLHFNMCGLGRASAASF